MYGPRFPRGSGLLSREERFNRFADGISSDTEGCQEVARVAAFDRQDA
jgi:hypothetical protein